MADSSKPSPPELKNLKPALPDVWDLAKLEASVNATSQRAVTQWLAYLSPISLRPNGLTPYKAIARGIKNSNHDVRDTSCGENKRRIRSELGIMARADGFAFNIMRSGVPSLGLCPGHDAIRSALNGPT